MVLGIRHRHFLNHPGGGYRGLAENFHQWNTEEVMQSNSDLMDVSDATQRSPDFAAVARKCPRVLNKDGRQSSATDCNGTNLVRQTTCYKRSRS